MIWKIITVGQPALPWARDGVADYYRRLGRYTRSELIHLKPAPRASLEVQMLKHAGDCHKIALHESGRRLRSIELAQWVDRQQLQATKGVALLIGGANGHSEELLKSADELWSLSDFTLQHEIALVVVLEQIYRAHTILKREPYHRE